MASMNEGSDGGQQPNEYSFAGTIAAWRSWCASKHKVICDDTPTPVLLLAAIIAGTDSDECLTGDLVADLLTALRDTAADWRRTMETREYVSERELDAVIRRIEAIGELHRRELARGAR